MSIGNTLSNLWDQTAFMNLEWGNFSCLRLPVFGNQKRL